MGFWFSRVKQQSQYKHNTAVAKSRWITIQMKLPLRVSIHLLSWCWVSRIIRKKYVGWNQLKPIALFKVGCSVFMLDVGLCAMLVWLAQEDNHTFWLTQATYTTSWSLNWYANWSTTKATLLSLFYWDKFSFLYDSCGCSLYSSLSIMGALPVPISSEPPSAVGVCWLVTALGVEMFMAAFRM